MPRVSLAPPTADTIASTLADRWRASLQAGERFEVDTGGADDHTRIEAVLVSGSERSEFVVEADGTDRTAFDLAVDALDAVIGEWLESDRPRLTGVPEARERAGRVVTVTSRVRRPDLE